MISLLSVIFDTYIRMLKTGGNMYVKQASWVEVEYSLATLFSKDKHLSYFEGETL